MFRKIASTALLITLTSTVPVLAADEIKAVTATTPAVVEALTAPVNASAASMSSLLRNSKPAVRGSLLPSLYVGLAGLNAYDAYTTVKGIAGGAKETNGLMAKATGTPMAVWAIKGGVTAGSILMSERLWRSGHRAEAIGMMMASNALMAAVGARNNSVLRNQR